MEKERFIEVVKGEVEKRAGVEIVTEQVRKNNGLTLTGMIFKEQGSNASVTIYVEDFYEAYQSGVEMEEIIDVIYKEYMDNRITENIDLSDFREFAKAKINIVCKLVNYEANKDMLENIPHRRFMDLALSYYYIVQQTPYNGMAYIQITNNHMDFWGINEEELLEVALINVQRLLPAKLDPIENVITRLTEKHVDLLDELSQKIVDRLMQKAKEYGTLEQEFPMYVLTNKGKTMGAVAIIYPEVLKEFADKVKSDLYILPSSIHETILLPANTVLHPEELAPMVKDINSKVVNVVERLSDNVYIYHRKEDKIEML